MPAYAERMKLGGIRGFSSYNRYIGKSCDLCNKGVTHFSRETMGYDPVLFCTDHYNQYAKAMDSGMDRFFGVGDKDFFRIAKSGSGWRFIPVEKTKSFNVSTSGGTSNMHWRIPALKGSLPTRLSESSEEKPTSAVPQKRRRGRPRKVREE
jgi:hypothetical protein